MATKKKKKLTNREILFREEYIRCWNAAASARAAGYSAKTAREIGYKLLTKVHIQEAIEERLAQIRMTTNEIYARLTAQASASLANMIEPYAIPILDRDHKKVGERQSIRLKDEALEKYGHLIKSISPTANGDFKVELYSAQTALELMGKTYSLFADRDDKGNVIQPAVNVYIPKNDRDVTEQEDDDSDTG